MTGQRSAPTLRALLFTESGDDLPRAVVRALHNEGPVGAAVSGGRRFSASARRFLRGEITRAVGQALELDVGDLLIAGWRKHQALTAAARATRATPGRREVVELFTHTIQSRHEPYVDVLLDDRCVARVRLDLTVSLTVAGLCGVVQSARLVELDVGNVTVTASLAVENVPLPARSRAVDPDLVVRLPRGGLPLLSSDDERGIPAGQHPTLGPDDTARRAPEPLALRLPWGREVELPDDGELILGRADEAFRSPARQDLMQVSRKHACFFRNSTGTLYVQDLGSTNGTYLDEDRLAEAPVPVQAGHRVRFGRDVTCLVVPRRLPALPDPPACRQARQGPA